MTGSSRIPLGPSRYILQRMRELLSANPELAPRYEKAKAVARIFRKPAFYEVSQRCNLWCEGCYYFEGERREAVEPATAAWESFFEAEAARGVSIGYFVGAEPALHPERLHAASQAFRYGIVATNGSIRIDPAVPYRIFVSVWAADDATDKRLRGASVFRKAMKNYAGDRRAMVIFTLSPWNLAGARTMAEMCRDHDLALTFNMYSPTGAFLDRLGRAEVNDNQYFRVSRPDSTPCFSDEDLAEARRVVDELMDDFGDTIVYSRPYNEWVTQPGPLHEIDPATGVATYCGSRTVGQMNYYTADHQPTEVKCCTPNLDCSKCRMYSAGWSTKLQPSMADLANVDAFSQWLDMVAITGQIFAYERDRMAAPPPVQPQPPRAVALAS